MSSHPQHPAYLSLGRDALAARVARGIETLRDCRACPRDCGVNRLEGKWAACKTGRYAVVGSYFAHFGEEDCLRGWNGSGTIFFSHCNLRCVFCFHPETLVATNEGAARIASLFERGEEIGHPNARDLNGSVKVVTRESRWAPVANAFRHDFTGELVQVKPYNGPPILATPNHELFASTRTRPDRVLKIRADQLSREHWLIVPRRNPLGQDGALEVGQIQEPDDRVAIHGIERVPYDGPVYNLEVDDPDHSYLAPFVAVANCQNYDISQAIKPTEAPPGSPPEAIAAMMLELQSRGCHNINFVTPEHVVPQVIEAVAVAIERGLALPVVYNTSAYDSLESLQLMEGIVDIYMPDFKYWSAAASKRYMMAENYPAAAREAIREMHRQVGPLVVDENGLARRGLIVRHLVMPGSLDETRAILEWVVGELGPETYVNLMDQYRPAGRVTGDTFPEIDRRLTSDEFREARAIARDLGLQRLDERHPHLRLVRRIAFG